MKVLVVEDSPIVVARLVELLEGLPNLEVVGSAGDADDAIRRVSLSAPDVIVLDLHLAGGTGLEVLRAAKGGPRKIVVIVLTNFASALFRQACLEAGAEYFLDKSNEFDQLPALLEHIRGESGSDGTMGSSGQAAETGHRELGSKTSHGRRTGTR
jgi:CheY-like chemotaxis protein